MFCNINNLKNWKWPFLWHFTAKNDTEWWLLHMTFGMSMFQGQTITVSSFDNYTSSLRTSTAWKTLKIAIFTAFYGKKWHWMTTASHDFWHDHVSESNQYCSTVCHLWQLFFNTNNPKNCENGHFYGILRQKMTPDYDSITWFLAWICLRVKPILFNCLPP